MNLNLVTAGDVTTVGDREMRGFGNGRLHSNGNDLTLSQLARELPFRRFKTILKLKISLPSPTMSFLRNPGMVEAGFRPGCWMKISGEEGLDDC